MDADKGVGLNSTVGCGLRSFWGVETVKGGSEVGVTFGTEVNGRVGSEDE